jgi:thiosulfate/3-mercaptopyruvate sulfurtransferase
MTATLAICAITIGANPTYPRPDLLIEPAALARPEAAKEFVVLDARPRARYDAGHVPAARWVDHADWEKGFGDGADAAAWSKRIGGLGITPASRVVVYDDSHSKDAARVWWILRYWGLTDARLLNGGWTGWATAGLPTETASTAPAPATFPATPAADRLATKAEVLGAIRGGKTQIVDARSEGEYCGVEALKNKRAGAMPGAKQLEWIDLLDKDTRRFKPAAEVARLFAAAGIDPAKPTVTHCQGGGRAAVMAFALELMGGTAVQNYYKSWGEWGNADDTPVVKPAPRER